MALRILAALGLFLLVFLGLVLLLVLIALLLRVLLIVDKPVDGPLRVVAGYGPVRLTLLPRPKRKPKKPPKPKKPKKPKKPRPEKPKKPKLNLRGLDIGEAIALVLDFLYELRHRLRIERLQARVMIATGDAAKTGILLGQSAAITGMLLPFLQQTYHIPDFGIQVDGDFECEKPSTRFSGGLTLAFRPIHLPILLLMNLKRLWALWRSIRPLKEPKTNKSPETNEEKENEQ